jgi:hypothetical protein
MDNNLVEQLQIEIENLKKKLEDTEQQLKRYTNGNNHKRYYEKNKEKVKENGSIYLKKLKEENPEKIKEYSRRAYLKQKEKNKEQLLNTNNSNS